MERIESLKRELRQTVTCPVLFVNAMLRLGTLLGNWFKVNAKKGMFPYGYIFFNSFCTI